MDEVVYHIDNWSIVKLLGGLSIILTATIGFVFYIIQTRLLDKWRHNDQKEIETLKGLIDRNNSVITTILSKSQPDKIIEKRLIATETMWNYVIETKNKPPATFTLAYSILTDSELTIDNIRKISKGQLDNIAIESIVNKPTISDHENLRYLLPPKLWTTIFVYQAFINRTLYLTLKGLQTNDFKYWKNDNSIMTMLKTVLDEKETNYIQKLEFQSYDTLVNLLQHKILIEINRVLSGESHSEDNLKVVKRISDLLKKD